MKKVRPYMALRTPMSATRPARSENSSRSALCRPNNFTSIAPETLSRSFMVVFMLALRSMLSRVRACNFLPTLLVGSTKMGRSATARSVSRHSSISIAMRVVASTMLLEMTCPRVPVMARWAPMTSLFIRLMSEPVWTRVKKAMGSR